MVPDVPTAVVETEAFLAVVRKLMDEKDREDLIDFLAWNPVVGDIIAGTGGIRKVRWALKGRGKRGGARVIYYYHDERLPLYVLAAYAKNEQGSLSLAERNRLRQVTTALAAIAKGRN